MGPSLSIWLYRTRARLSEAETPALSPPDPGDTGPLVWVHCPNEDASTTLTELIRVTHQLRPDQRVLLTYPAGAKPIATGPHISTVELAADTPATARDLLKHWQPTAAIFCSGDLPPAILTEAARRNVPLGLFADGPPERGLPKALFKGRMANALVHRFNQIFLKSPRWADPLRRFGVPIARMELTGPLSEGSHALPCNEAERDDFARRLAGRPTWLAMGVTRAETPMAIAAHAKAESLAHRLLMILVPDDAARGPDLADSLRAEGWRVALRSADQEPTEDTQIYVADVEGETGLWFRLSPISFLGQTYGRGTPPDPFHPAALGSAILHGPVTGDQADRFRKLGRAGAAREVGSDKALGVALTELMAPEHAAAMAHSGWDISSQGAEATERVAQWLLDTIDKAEAR